MKWFPLDVFLFGQIILIDEEEKEIIFLIIQVLLLCECIDDFILKIYIKNFSMIITIKQIIH